MKLVFFTNYINHHQIYVADEFYKILNSDYYFVETQEIPEFRKKLGYPVLDRPYLVKTYESSEMLSLAYKLAYEADVVILGSAPESFVRKRLDDNKLTFHYSERWFKKGYKSLLSPRFWKWLYQNHLKYRNSHSYMLCASAYTALDVNLVGAYMNKCFRWGYFTKVENLNIKEIQKLKLSNTDGILRLMWCARFLKWKHPELPVMLATRLKKKGYIFEINMFGGGEELDKTQKLAKKLGVDDVVNFCGNLPNDEIIQKMREHDIFLFTSDRNEGWGAVLNESMSNGCAVVGSDIIGSVPFLIEDGVNGMIFKSEDLNSLESKVVDLIENPEQRVKMSIEAYRTMKDIWSPENAAKNFSILVTKIEDEAALDGIIGPCSIAD